MNKLTRNYSPEIFPLFKDDFLSSASKFLEDFFPEFSEFNTGLKLIGNTGYPKFNIYEYSNELIIDATVPGLDKNEIQIEVENYNDNTILKIKGEKQYKDKKIEKKIYCHEIKQSSFVRSLILPKNIDLDNIKTNLDKGILTIKIPKKEEEELKKIKTIEIK